MSLLAISRCDSLLFDSPRDLGVFTKGTRRPPKSCFYFSAHICTAMDSACQPVTVRHDPTRGPPALPIDAPGRPPKRKRRRSRHHIFQRSVWVTSEALAGYAPCPASCNRTERLSTCPPHHRLRRGAPSAASVASAATLLAHASDKGFDPTRPAACHGRPKEPLGHWQTCKCIHKSAPTGAIHKVAQTYHFSQGQGAIGLKVHDRAQTT